MPRKLISKVARPPRSLERYFRLYVLHWYSFSSLCVHPGVKLRRDIVAAQNMGKERVCCKVDGGGGWRRFPSSIPVHAFVCRLLYEYISTQTARSDWLVL